MMAKKNGEFYCKKKKWRACISIILGWCTHRNNNGNAGPKPKKQEMKNDDKANFITLYSTNDRKRRWNREHNTHEHEHTRKLENGNRAK